MNAHACGMWEGSPSLSNSFFQEAIFQKKKDLTCWEKIYYKTN
jgi:hypothetical protein